MKNFYLLLALVSATAIAQTDRLELDQIAEAEKKAAAKIMNFVENPNTWNYDVKHATIELTADIDNFVDAGNAYVLEIAGKVTTKFAPLESTNTITLELTKGDAPFQMTVASVTYEGTPVGFVHNASDELIITFPSVLNVGTDYTVVVEYSGYPTGSGFGSFVCDYHDGTPVVWTLSEPFGARDWWPCKQDLNDKVDEGVDMYITAPSQYRAAANGMEQSITDNGDGTETTHFKHTYPIPAYLIAFAVTDYEVYTQQAGLGTPESPFFPIINYSFPEDANAIENSVAVTPGIMNFFEETFGAYPFREEKYGHCQFAWGGGMEHTTVSFMTAGNNGYSRSLIAHELGHQWFGDKVTCGSWQDIWLNEGFATYMAAMVVEEFDGDNSFTTQKGNMINTITSQAGGAVYLTPSEALNVNRIFSSRLSYNKGAMVLHMLRFKLGDTAFFSALGNYLNDPQLAYAYAVTDDLQAHLETASGVDLDEFFNDWVYKQGYPIFDITAHNTTPGHASITINQNQSHNSVDFFQGPVPVRLLGSGDLQQDIVLENTTDNQTFNIDVPFVLTGIVFNPKNDIISRNSEAVLSTGSFDLMTAISLYPNPAHDRLTLDLPSGVTVEQTTFYNALGQQAKTTQSETSWEVADLASGVYFLNVQTDAGTKQLKFVKK
ncbi:M1 family aminopeptidase [Flavobacterium caeni]|uniref:Aminopeptidase N n=1 Tax=Flavobacterium caeni TaxID=490189 RepID=A0A1G5E857_9FLAO|nr:M1 family aminopeptidase [Flavobacterium caeni]SCY22688.1 Por secretion system C-terminal sorting domain-containing protein [Flavobacterium caeni]